MKKIKRKFFALFLGIVLIMTLGQTLYGQTDTLLFIGDTTQNMGDEILHTPYRTIKRSLYTGSISTLKGSDVENNPILYRTNSMAGMLGGISVHQSIGNPGYEYADVYLRGLSVDQLLIDGILVDPNQLNAMGPIDPYDIESISILKDAMATSEYGIRGGLGIINIITKRGYDGKPKVSINTQTGFKTQTVPFKPVNSYEYVKAVNLWDHNLGKTPDKYTYQPDVVAKYKDICENGYDDINNPLDRYLYPNNNYQDLFLKPYTMQSRINMNIRGGNKFAKYFLSTNYISNSGSYKVDDINTYNTNTLYNFFGIRSNVDIQATHRLLVSLDIIANQDRNNTPGNGGNVIYGGILMTPPNNYPIFNPNGSLGKSSANNSNIYGMINKEGYEFSLTRTMYGRLTLKQELDNITKGLSVSGGVNFSNQFLMTVTRNKAFQSFKIDVNSTGPNNLDSLKYIAGNTNPTVMNSKAPTWGTLYNILNFDLGLDYNRQFGKNGVTSFLRFNNQTIDYNNSELPRVFRGIRGGLSYVYDNKYIAEATYCMEATERLPESSKYVPFYAYGLSWVVSNENFLQNNNLVSFLKLSYNKGIAGIDNIPYFEFLPEFALGGAPGLGLGYNPTLYSNYTETKMPTTNNVPEMYSTDNIRLDMAFFDNRLTASLDLWKRKQYNIRIQSFDFPLSVGSSFPLVPQGIRKYKGYELEVGYTGKTGDFKYHVSGTVNQFASEMIKSDQSTQPYDYLLVEGLPVGASFGFELLGYFKNQEEIDQWPTYKIGTPKPGDFKAKDINGDGVVNTNDMVYKGRINGVPEMQYGINASLEYKGIDLSVLFHGQYGGDSKRNHENWGFTEFSEGGLGTVFQYHLNSFVPDDPSTWDNATWGLLYSDNPISRVFQSNYSQVDYSFLRVKNVEFGYTFPVKLLDMIKIERLRIYFSGYNLITWGDTFWGFDIEAPSNGRHTPIQKIYNFGLNVTF